MSDFWYRRNQPKTEIERFWEKIEPEPNTGCWLWLGAISSAGYPQFACLPRLENGRLRQVGAHRYSYELLVGPILAPQLDHLCRTRVCVNPSHLEPVTERENTLRGIGPSALNAAKTRCIHGHDFTPENTWVNPKTGARHCRPCMRRRWHEWNARKRQQPPEVLLEQEMRLAR